MAPFHPPSLSSESSSGMKRSKPSYNQHSFSSAESSVSDIKNLSPSTCDTFVDDFFRFQSDTWAFEILSLFVSVVALVSAIVALRYYDGKPNPEWPFALTLNALISICMTIMVASLTVPVSGGLGQLKWMLARAKPISVMDLDTLDRASRGMWGSICALFTVTGGALGMLGSIIMIVAFAAGPFGQQAVLTSIGAVEQSQDPATVLWSCIGGNKLSDICPITGLTGTSQKGENIKASFLRRSYYSSIYGSFNRSTVSDNLAACPSGNCTWAPFSTLSLCQRCKNVTEYLKVEKSLGSTKTTAQLASLPNGPSLDAGFGSFEIGLTKEPDTQWANAVWSSRLNSTNATVYTFAALEASEDGQISAIECSLDLCVQFIGTSYSNGLFTEEILSEYPGNILRTEMVPGSIRNTTIEVPDQVVFDQSKISNMTNPGTQLSVPYSTIPCLNIILELDDRENVRLGEIGIEGIPAVIENLAISAGRGLRTVCLNSTQVIGSSWRNVNLVRVDWIWFILPLIVEFLSVCFFVWILLSNNYSKSKLWKTSLVAALYHNVIPLQRQIQDMETLVGMEKAAEEMKVILWRGSDNERSLLVEQ